MKFLTVPGRSTAPPPWLVWAIGCGVYVLAVFHRSSLGVAGPLAAERMSLTAAQLSSFVMVQLAIYAAMQIPTGILVDRFGPRKMLLAATLTMGTGQILFSLVDGYIPGLLARGVLGCGDAMTYISVLRLVAGWYPAQRYAVMTMLTGFLGAVGNLIATLPLTGLLAGLGWMPTFLIAGGLSVAYSLLLLRPANRAPLRAAAERAATGPMAGGRVRDEVRTAWRLPAGRLGFWVHFTTMAGPTTFGVLWGFPYLTQAQGMSAGQASTMLLLLVLGGIVANLILGQLLGRRPVVRTPLALAVALAGMCAWLVLILWPGGQPPFAVLLGCILVFSIGGPTSAVAFMLARDYNPAHRISTATGMVNVGGFTGAVICCLLVGVILDLTAGGGPITSFRWALGAIALVNAVGLARMTTWWLRTRATVLLAEARGEDIPVPIRLHRWELVDADDLAAAAGEADQERADRLPPDDLRLDDLRPDDIRKHKEQP